MKPKTKKLLKELENLQNEAGATLYVRTQKAIEVYKDHEYIAEVYGGDAGKAMDGLSAFFATCALTFGNLRDLMDRWPTKQEWEDQKYDVKYMLATLIKERRGARRTESEGRKTATLKDLAERDDSIKELEYRLKKRDDEFEFLADANKRLAEENAKLREENSELRGRLDQMEKMFSGSSFVGSGA